MRYAELCNHDTIGIVVHSIELPIKRRQCNDMIQTDRQDEANGISMQAIRLEGTLHCLLSRLPVRGAKEAYTHSDSSAKLHHYSQLCRTAIHGAQWQELPARRSDG
jgi:hypothetical protein